MSRNKVTVVCVLLMATALVAATSSAIEVKLTDGTVLQAESYQVTGSFVMLTLATGQRMAYAVEDVDIEWLKAQETPGEETPAEEPSTEKKGLGTAFGGAVSTVQEGASTFTLTDHDVGHLRPDEAEDSGEEESEEEAAGGGSVALSKLKITQVEGAPGTYEVLGTITNGSSVTVSDVRVTLRVEDWEQELSVVASLASGKEASFSYRFPSSSVSPQVAAKVLFHEPKPSASPPASEDKPSEDKPSEDKQ